MQLSTHKGSKYVSGRSVKFVAELVRKDIKAAQKAGKLRTDVKISVRCDGVSALRITVTAAPLSCFNPEYRKSTNFTYPPVSAYTDEGKALLKALHGLAAEYQFQESDSMADYMNNNFYLTADMDWKLQRDALDALEKAERPAA